jgi:hypothetical protein
MRNLNRFEKFINESLGVGDPTIIYIRKLTYAVLEEFYNFVEQTRDIGKESEEYLEYEVVIPYQSIKSTIPKGPKGQEIYSKFPVSEIIMNLHLSKKNVSNMHGNDYMVGGYAMPFAKGRELQATRFKDPIKQNFDHSISVYMGVEVMYGPYFRRISFNHPHFENTKLLKKVESVISHELNHLYEFYNRKMGGKPGIKIAPTMASIGENTYDIPDTVFKMWSDDFLSYIYCSEPHEVNAQVQEADSYVSRMNLTGFKRTRLWKESQKMKNWEYKDFLEELKYEIEDEGLNYEEVVEHMRTQFLNELEKWESDLKEDSRFNTTKLRNMSIEKFFGLFEKRIKESGEILTRNFLRLFSRKDK